MALIQPLPRKYKGHRVAFLALMVAFGAVAVYGEHGAKHLGKLWDEQTSLEQQAFQLQQHNELLRQHISRLEHDDAYLERTARERYGLVRPDELVYRDTPPHH